jgi:hypothetical protein
VAKVSHKLARKPSCLRGKQGKLNGPKLQEGSTSLVCLQKQNKVWTEKWNEMHDDRQRKKKQDLKKTKWKKTFKREEQKVKRKQNEINNKKR